MNKLKEGKEKCNKGHPWVPENIYTDKKGFKGCRKCRSDGVKLYQARVKANMEKLKSGAPIKPEYLPQKYFPKEQFNQPLRNFAPLEITVLSPTWDQLE